jgi:secreted PhoX family phosphatase
VPSIFDDYQYKALIPWGTPTEPNSTEDYVGDPSSRSSAQEAAQKTGIGHDGMWLFPENNRHYKYRRYGYQLSIFRGMLFIHYELGSIR